MEYVTRHLFLPQHWVASTAYTTDDYCNANGNCYKCSSAGTSSATTAPTGQTTGITDGTAKWDYYNTPIEALLADTDLCLFDYDIVELGVKAKYIKEHGGQWKPVEMEYKRAVEEAVNRTRVPHVGSFSRRGRQRGGWSYRIPYKSWDI